MLIPFYLFDRYTMEDSFTKHLPFWLLAKKLKKRSFEAWSSNHFGIFWSWSCALCQAGGRSKGLKSWARSTGSGSKNPKWFKDLALKLRFFKFLASNENEQWSSIVRYQIFKSVYQMSVNLKSIISWNSIAQKTNKILDKFLP